MASRETPARFAVAVIKGLDLSAMVTSDRGSGSASYRPAVPFSVLVYGYATGVFSSRQSECGTYGGGLAISGVVKAAPLPSFGQTAPKM